MRTLLGATGRALRAVGADLLEGIWTPRCWVCGSIEVSASGPLACAEHALADARAAADGPPRCHRCADRLPPGIAAGSRCARCRRDLPAFDGVRFALDYGSGAARAWLLPFKHGGRRDLAVPLGDCLAGAWSAAQAGTQGALESSHPALLVPVPLHPARRLERGYDQAGLLAQELASKRLGPWAPLLQRRRSTVPQGAPDAPARGSNVRGAFVLRRGAPALGGVHVWLVDDVLTSGATASACARVLRRAGAARVGVLCVARA